MYYNFFYSVLNVWTPQAVWLNQVNECDVERDWRDTRGSESHYCPAAQRQIDTWPDTSRLPLTQSALVPWTIVFLSHKTICVHYKTCTAWWTTPPWSFWHSTNSSPITSATVEIYEAVNNLDHRFLLSENIITYSVRFMLIMIIKQSVRC